MRENSQVKGFTLIELLVVIAIIAILAAVVLIIINPLEIIKRGRDSTRLQDLDSLQKTIGLIQTDNAASICFGLTPPCTDKSNNASSNNRKVDGTGWIKINFSAQNNVTIPVLPVDPVNDATFYYTYYSDGADFELDTKLESSQFASKMTGDGGDNPAVYEAGSKLDLIN